MDKQIIKISVRIYVFIKIILGLIAPFFSSYIAYELVKPNNILTVILFIIVWFIVSFILIIIAKYLHEGIRCRFEKIDNYLNEIENYIENQKYN